MLFTNFFRKQPHLWAIKLWDIYHASLHSISVICFVVAVVVISFICWWLQNIIFFFKQPHLRAIKLRHVYHASLHSTILICFVVADDVISFICWWLQNVAWHKSYYILAPRKGLDGNGRSAKVKQFTWLWGRKMRSFVWVLLFQV